MRFAPLIGYGYAPLPMPVTPFHFGPGAALHALAPKRISFLAFCASNVLIDVEPLYYMVTRQYPLHRFFHTYLGATLAAGATVLVFIAARKIAWLPNLFGWRDLRPLAIALGALLGTYSHIALDSVMHTDIRPFAPFSDANPLLRIVSLGALHELCIVAAAAGCAWLWVRKRIGNALRLPRT